MKIIEIAATRWHILKLKFTIFYFGWGSASDPSEGDFGASPDHLAGFPESTSNGHGLKAGR